MTECTICGKRRVKVASRCHICEAQIKAQTGKAKPVQPVKYLTYKGYVLGLYPSDTPGKLVGRLVNRDPDKLPKCRTINLNKWCEGFNRATIKQFKAKVLRAAQAAGV